MTFHKKNLNVISFEAIFDLLDEIHRKFRVKKVFIDTLGDPRKCRETLEKRYGTAFVVEEKADSNYKIVSRASIVAKVTRDRLLCDLDPACGSGYPAGPATRLWLRKNLNPVFGYPEIVRFSWMTVDEFLPKRRAPRMRGTFEGFYLSGE